MPLAGLSDKVVLITGGASGIGRATAERLVAEGANVAIVDLDEDHVTKVAGEIGERVVGLRGDVTSPKDVERYFGDAERALGPIDGLFNNAGIAASGNHIADTSPEQFERVVSTNLTGVFLNLRAMLRRCAERERPGAIVCTSSAMALRSMPGHAPYIASKAAVVALTKVAAVEGGPLVRVNALLPGPIDTPIIAGITTAMRNAIEQSLPLKRLGEAHEMAAIAAWLLSDESSYATGGAFVIDGGDIA
jgi:NAD(P)-dependent dehydrogenase (short-subunit alcohol dehydrogenase family)